jgi:RNA polymerase sigma factor (sigma-70 family)
MTDDEFRIAIESVVSSDLHLLCKIAGRYLHCREDVEDVVQDGLLLAWRFRGKFRGASSLKTWIIRIVANCALDMLRRQSAKSLSIWADRKGHELVGLTVLLPEPTLLPGFDEDIDLQQRREWLDQHVCCLSQGCSKVVRQVQADEYDGRVLSIRLRRKYALTYLQHELEKEIHFRALRKAAGV